MDILQKYLMPTTACFRIKRPDERLHLPLRKIMNLHAKNLAKNHVVLKITFYLIIIFLPKGEEKNIVHNVTQQ